MKTPRPIFFSLCFSLFFLFSFFGANAATASDENLVQFFKSAIASPPDVAHFTASLRRLSERDLPPEIRALIPNVTNRPAMFFEGARSGSNYFLREVVLTNGAFHANSDFAIGRDGLETYHLNPNSVTHTFDQSDSATPKHALLASSKVYFSLVSEILNMGLPSGIDPRGISWVDNDFTGLRYDNGLRVRGRLEVSNGYPCVLSIYSEQETRPYLAFRYMYPDPPSRLSGFPEKTTLSRITGGVLKPWMEVTLVDVRLAGDNETTKLFAKEQFISERIQHTHFYSNGILFTVSPEGKVYKSPKQPVVRLLGESTPDDKRRRSLLVILLLVIAGPPVVYLLFRSVKNNKSG